MKQHNIPGIQGIGTRKLGRGIREYETGKRTAYGDVYQPGFEPIREKTRETTLKMDAKKPVTVVVTGFLCGGDEEDRTLDLTDANRTLSQLSYAPICLRMPRDK